MTEGRRARDGRPGRLGGALAVPTGQVPAVPAGLTFGDAVPSADAPSAPGSRRAGDDGARPRSRRLRLPFGARPDPVPDVPAPSQGAWKTPTVIVRRPDGSVVEGTRRKAGDPAPAGGRSALPAYGAARRRSAPEPLVAGFVTATASGAASRAARDGDEGAGEAAREPSAIEVTAVAVSPPPAATTEAEPTAIATAAAGPEPGAATEGAGATVAAGAAESDDSAVGKVAADSASPTPGDVSGDVPGGGEGDLDGDDTGASSDGGRTPAVLRPLVSVGESVASHTTSARAGVVGALRVARDVGTSRLLPTDPEAREALNARLRRAGTYVGAVAVACVLIYAVFPVRTYLDQRAATRRAHEQIEVISEQNDRLEEQVEALGSEQEVERIAREEYGMVRPGEESYGILPPPAPTTTTTTTTTTTSTTTTTPPPAGGATSPSSSTTVSR